LVLKPSSLERASPAAAAAPSASGVRAPRVPERFEVLRFLGQGGMGSVYEVLDRRRERSLAMKVLRDPERGSIYRFKREFRAAAQLRHPNLVRLYDLGVLPDGNLYLTMELIVGRDLAAWAGALAAAPSHDASTLAASMRDTQGDTVATARETAYAETNARTAEHARNKARTGRTVPEVLLGVLDGLALLHAHRKVHRDIKPSNILVDEAGVAKILDFGIVRELDDPAGMTQGRAAIGTPLYMAPEQISGGDVGSAADLYALGCVLYELLTGSPPFSGPSVRVMVHHLSETPEPPSQRGSCEPRLDALCMALLAKDPASRPSARDVMRTLCEDFDLVAPNDGAAVRVLAAPVFFGRDEELRALERALEDAQHAPRIVLVGGESGAGKTALAAELAQSVQSRGGVAWFGRCYERESVPYKAFDAIVDAVSATLVRLGASAFRYFPPGSAALVRIFPVLREVEASCALPDETTLRDPRAERRRAIRALFAVLGNLSGGRAPVVVIDDLQWSDEESIEVLRWLAFAPNAPPCLVVATARGLGDQSPRDAPAASVASLVQLTGDRVARLPLPPLGAAALDRLVVTWGGDALSADLRSRLVDEARGNPFLAIELARAVAQDGRATSGTLPTIDEVVALRLEGVGQDARAVLEAAAVAGGRVRFSALASVVGLASGALSDALDELVLAGLLREAPGADEESFDLAHDRFREAAYRGVAAERRRDLHRLLALWFAEHADAARAVEHWRYAGEPERARVAALEAAHEAEAQLAFDRASALYALALGADASHEVRAAWASALAKAGRHRESARVLEESVAMAPAAEGAEETRLRAAVERLAAGDVQAAMDAFEHLLSGFGETLKIRRRFMRVWIFVAFLWWHVCRALVRKKLCKPGSWPPVADPRARFQLRLYDAIQHHLLTVDPVVATHFALKHALLAFRLRDVMHIGRAHIAFAARLAAVFGKYGRRRAISEIEQGEALCSEVGDSAGLLAGQYARSIIYVFDANLDALRRSVARADELARQGDLFGEPALLLLRSMHLAGEYLVGAIGGVVERGTMYVREARERGNVLHCGELLLTLSLAQLTRGDVAAARESMQEALRIVPPEPVTLQRLRLDLTSLELDIAERDFAGSRERLREVRERWRASGIIGSNLDRTLVRLNHIRIEIGAPECAVGRVGFLFDLWTRFAASSSPPIMRAFARRVGAAVHFRSGRLRAALREVQKSLRYCEAQNNTFGMGVALAARASIRSRAGLPGAELDRRLARAHLEDAGASECYMLATEGWDVPAPDPGTPSRARTAVAPDEAQPA
jgi:hypothetical protein